MTPKPVSGTSPPSHLNLWASGLYWLLGIGTLVIGVPIGFLGIGYSDTLLPLVGLVLLGATLCFAGFCLPKRRLFVRWWAALPCVASIVLLMLDRDGHPFLVGMHLALITFVGATWNWQADASRESSVSSRRQIAFIAVMFLLLALVLSVFVVSA